MVELCKKDLKMMSWILEGLEGSEMDKKDL